MADAESDRLFIADSGHHRIVVTTLEGDVLDVIGAGQRGLTDDRFSDSQFSAPQGMTLDRSNQILYVADTDNHALRRVDLNQKTVSTIAGTGAQSRTIYPHGGNALATALNSSWDLKRVGDRLFVAMAGSHQIWQMQLTTEPLKSILAPGQKAA